MSAGMPSETGGARKANESYFFLHQRLKFIQSEMAEALGFLDAWEALQQRQVTCHRGAEGTVVKPLVSLGTNLSMTPEGVLAC